MAYQRQTWFNDPGGNTPLSADRLNKLEAGVDANQLMRGLDASKPAAGVADRTYYATDTFRTWHDTGTAWVEAIPRAIRITAPTYVPTGVLGIAAQMRSYEAIGTSLFLSGSDGTSATAAIGVDTDQLLAQVVFNGNHATGTESYAGGASIRAIATAAFSSSSGPTNLVVSTTRAGASSPAYTAAFTTDGHFSVGNSTASPNVRLGGPGYIDFKKIAEPAAPGTGFIRIWADSGTSTMRKRIDTGAASDL